MGKYDTLGVFLRRWRARNKAEGVELSFAQIEGILRGVLPRAAAGADWWNTPGSSDGTAPHWHVWADAGFEAFVDPKAERVYFRKLAPLPAADQEV